ncbi:hypothetical protein CAPTEDRAFT_223937 [Capitella teleta]|uniref:YEATS domain-containing protein n=1 Tax=Capitella teleta TaxID=283909 RepID=R7TGC7_CAPTE|nr:hypothetical protein CAPTEDRAFT_223937 [Capitella teleta]|eukprot:ELT90175.1 hypothetical protein CAPTEDRAFT_223937 [Capitella teleta]
MPTPIQWEVEVYNRHLVCQQPAFPNAYAPHQMFPKIARGPGRPRKNPAPYWTPQPQMQPQMQLPKTGRGPGRPRKSPVQSWPVPGPTSPIYGCIPSQPANSPPKSVDLNNESVQVKLELGHSAVLRDRPTPDGLTHDWTMFIRGPEGSNIQHFVEKVIFYLHESFPKPKRVVKEPPYSVSESGYGSFLLPIEIVFRNRDEPKRIRFEYDLLLHLEKASPVNNIRCEKLTFQNPQEDFRRKLLKAGGIGVPSAHDVSSAPASAPSNPKPTPPPPPPPQPPKAHDEIFENLFGPPLQADAPKKLKDKPGPGRPKSSNKTPLASKGPPPVECKEVPVKKEASLSSSQSSVKSSSSSSGSSSKRPKSESSKRPPERSQSVESDMKRHRKEKERDKSSSSSKSKSTHHGNSRSRNSTERSRNSTERSTSAEKKDKSRHRHHHESSSSSSHKHKSHSSSSKSKSSRSSSSSHSHRSEKSKKPSKEREVPAKKPAAAKTIPQPPPPPVITPPPPPPPPPAVKPKEAEIPKSPKKDLRPFDEVLSTGEQSDFDPFEDSSSQVGSTQKGSSKALGKMIEELDDGSSEEHEMEEDMFPASSKVPWSPRSTQPKKDMMPHKKMSISDDEEDSDSSSSSSSSSSESEDEDQPPASRNYNRICELYSYIPGRYVNILVNYKESN